MIVVVELEKRSDVAGLPDLDFKANAKCAGASDRITHHPGFRRHRNTRQHRRTFNPGLPAERSSYLDRTHCQHMPTARLR